MGIRRVVPDLRTTDLERSRGFYGRLGLETVMDHGWVVALAGEDSGGNASAQLILVTRDATAAVDPDVSIEVDDVDAAYAEMRAAGAEIVHELRDELWGVRRFFVRDPDGNVVNVLTHQ